MTSLPPSPLVSQGDMALMFEVMMAKRWPAPDAALGAVREGGVLCRRSREGNLVAGLWKENAINSLVVLDVS